MTWVFFKGFLYRIFSYALFSFGLGLCRWCGDRDCREHCRSLTAGDCQRFCQYFLILHHWWIIQDFPCHNSNQTNSFWDPSDRHHPSMSSLSLSGFKFQLFVFLVLWRAYFVIGWLNNELARVLFQKKGKKGWENRWVRHWQFEQPYEHHPIHIHTNAWTLAGFLCRCLFTA